MPAFALGLIRGDVDSREALCVEVKVLRLFFGNCEELLSEFLGKVETERVAGADHGYRGGDETAAVGRVRTAVGQVVRV